MVGQNLLSSCSCNHSSSHTLPGQSVWVHAHVWSAIDEENIARAALEAQVVLIWRNPLCHPLRSEDGYRPYYDVGSPVANLSAHPKVPRTELGMSVDGQHPVCSYFLGWGPKNVTTHASMSQLVSVTLNPAYQTNSYATCLGKMDWIAARGPQKPWRRIPLNK